MVGGTKRDSTSKPEQHDLPSLLSSVTSTEWTTFSIENFQHQQSYPQHSFWASHSTPALFPSPLTLICHSHIQKILDFLPNGGLQFYSALREPGEMRKILILTGAGGVALRLRPLSGRWRPQWNRAGGKGFWQLSLPLGELHRWMHSFQSHHTAWETKSYHRTSQGFQALRCALPQRGRLDRNRCDNKWPLELHPESCWLFPESCSSSWVPGFSLETLRSWHIAKKGQQQEIEKQSVRSKGRGDRTTVHTYLKILPLFSRIKIPKSKKKSEMAQKAIQS